MRLAREDRAMLVAINAILLLMAFLFLYPFWNSAAISLNHGQDTALGGITFWPREFTLQNYVFVLQDPRIIQAFFVSAMRTAVGTVLAISFTSLFAYGMSKRELRFRRFYMVFCLITMYFYGGLIPRYILIRNLGLFNTFWVMVIPTMVSVWNMIIFRSFFMNIPDSLEESAMIDGAGYYRRFISIIVPVSKPVFATLTLFVAVGHWNQWFDAALYIREAHLIPIQTLLRQIIDSNAVTDLIAQLGGQAAETLEQQAVTTKALSMSTMMIATIPIILVYPFLQRFFVKGIMIGSLKG